jgi:hypothetical protein
VTLDVITAARRRTRRRLAAVLVGVGVLAAVLVVVVYPAFRYADRDRPVPLSTSDGPRPTASQTVGGSVLPADVSWIRLTGVDLPVSAATGPTEVRAGLSRGFTHSRGGAVVAAVHILVRTTAHVGPVVFEPTLADQVVGPHADAMRRAVADTYTATAARTGITYGQPLGDLPAALAGVRVDAYRDDRATVSVLTAAPDSTGVTRYAATTVTVSWTRGDWRLVAPPDGRWDSQVLLVDPERVGDWPPLRAG